MQCVVASVWLIVLASCSTLYGKVPRLILRKTSRLTQAVVFSRSHFLCGALLCNCSSAEREGLSIHVQRECSAEPFMPSILSLRILTSRPGCRLRFFITMQIRYSYEHTFVRQQTLCAENPVFEIVQEVVKVCTTGMFSRTFYAQHPVTKNLHISPPFLPTIFYRDANPVLLLAHLCTAVLI